MIGPDQDDGHGLRPQAHQIADLEAALDADAPCRSRRSARRCRRCRTAAAAARRTRPCRRRPAPSKSNRSAACAPGRRGTDGDHARVALRPDRVVEIAVGSLVRIDVLVAVGRGQPRAFLGDQEARARRRRRRRRIPSCRPARRRRGRAGNRRDGAAARRLAERAQPGVQQIALLDRSDHRGIGAFEFHSAASRIRSRRRTECGRARDGTDRGR